MYDFLLYTSLFAIVTIALSSFASYLTLNNTVTFKSGLEVTQGHWNWCHSKVSGAVSYSLSIVTMAVSVAVCEIFNVKEWCDLENKVRVRSRSLDLLAFQSNYGAILYRLWDIARYWSKIAKFLYPTCIYRSGRLNFAKMFDPHKTRMIRLPCGEKRL